MGVKRHGLTVCRIVDNIHQLIKVISQFPVLSLRLDLLRKAYHISPKYIVAAGLPFKGKSAEMKDQEHYKKNGFLHYLFSSKLIAKPPPLAMVI